MQSFSWMNLEALHPCLPVIEAELIRLSQAQASQAHQPLADLETYNQHYGFQDLMSRFPNVSHHQMKMHHENFDVFVQLFLQHEQPKGCIFVYHGYLDHLGLYKFPIELALDLGFNVIGYDLPGHGLSSGPKGTIEAFDLYGHLHNEVIDLIKTYEPLFPRPWVGLGQSTGCAVMMQGLLHKAPHTYEKVYDGLVFLAPLIRTSKWYYTKSLYFFLKHKGAIPRTFKNNSSDLDFLNFIKYEDPLQYRMIEAQWVGAMMRYVKHIIQCQKHPLQPLVIQGDQDETVSFHYNMKALKWLFSKPLQIKLPGAAHHLVNESTVLREQIKKDIIQYIQRLTN